MNKIHKLFVGATRFVSIPQNAFVIIAVLFGASMAVIMPPLLVPDEASHFYRAFQISEGNIYSDNHGGKTGGWLPREVSFVGGAQSVPADFKFNPSTIDDGFSKKINYDDRTFSAFNNTAVYSPISYIPQTLAIFIGKILDTSPLAMLYLGRFLNLMFFISLTYLAIRLLPFGKWALAVIALLPMMIQQAASQSSDVMVISLGFISVSLFLHMLFDHKKLSNGRWLLILLLAIMLGLTKQTNALLIAPFLFLPGRLFSTHKKHVVFAASIFLAAVLSTLVWYLAVKSQHYDMDFAYISTGKSDQAAQLHFIIQHPLTYLHTLSRTLIYSNIPGFPTTDFYWLSMFGYFSWFTYKMPTISMIFGYANLILALLVIPTSTVLSKLTGRIRVVLWMTLLGSIIGILTVLYLVGNLVGVPVIRNLQGRYFLVLLPLLIPLLANGYFGVNVRKQWIACMVFMGISVINLAVMLRLTLTFFY